MSKIYTVQELREMAKLYKARAKDITEVCSRRGGSAMITVFASQGISDHKVSAMLLQAAGVLERIREEIKKIDTMEVAPLDGHPMHQNTNTEKVATVLEFFPKVKEILGGVKSQEGAENN